MDYKNCVRCNEANLSDMRFCQNCGAEFTQMDELPPTVMAGFGANLQGAQMPPPNYQMPNYQPQQPNFQPQPPINYQQQHYQTAPASGGQTKKILLGIGGVLIGLIMLGSGGVKLYRAFSGPSYTPTTVSPTPQNLFGTTTNSSNQSTLTPSPASRTIADLTQQRVGGWTLRDTTTGNPEKDGFSGASEEKQFKYYNSADDLLHVTLAEYPTAAAAESGLRTTMQKFKVLKLKVGEEIGAEDNDKNPIGITQTMSSANGKLFTRYWTNKNFLFRVLGTERQVEEFFRASNF